MNYLSQAFHCKQRRAHINDINILNSLLFYITWGQHNIVLVLTASTVLILICYVLIIILAAYLVSFLNLLNRVQSCNKNHLLLGPNCEEDHPLMKAYTHWHRQYFKFNQSKTACLSFFSFTTTRQWVTVFKGGN